MKRFLYTVGFSLLLLTAGLSVYYGVKALQFNHLLTTQPKASIKKYHFILIPQEVNNAYWQMVKKGADAAEKDFSVSIEYTGPEQTNTAEHIKIIKMAISSKVDGIITQGLNDKAFTPVINQAVEKGIPVITIDTDDPNSQRFAYVGTDNYQAGYLAGQTLIKDMHGKAKVGIITGDFQSTNQKLRVKGFRDAVKRRPGIKIVAIKSSHITQIQAAEDTYQIVKDHPEVNAFFGTSALDGLGIAAVIQNLGKTKNVYILAFDTLPETISLIKQGVISATVVQKPYQMGYNSVKLLMNHISEKHVPVINHTETKVIHKDDLPLNPTVLLTEQRALKQ